MHFVRSDVKPIKLWLPCQHGEHGQYGEQHRFHPESKTCHQQRLIKCCFQIDQRGFFPQGGKDRFVTDVTTGAKGKVFLSRDFSVWSSHCLSHCERSFCQNCQFRRQCQSGSGKSDKKKSSRWKRNCCFYFYEMIDSMTDGQNLCGETALSILSNSRFHLM